MATIIGTSGNDNLTGTSGDDQIYGEDGNDILSGGAGNDTLDGGAGSDTASYAETTQGVSVNLGLGTAQGTESGSDTLVSIENAIGGSGNDTFDWSSSVGNSDINGGGGTDLVETNNTSTATLTPLADGSAQLAVDGAVITTTDVENLRIRGASTGTSFVVAGDFSGTAMAAGNWVIQGSFSGSPNDSVDASGLTSANSIMFFGEAGNDRFIMAASGANDYFDGAAGVDTVDYSAATAGVMVDLTAGTATGSQIGTDAIVNVENATGGAGNDTLTGSAADNQLSGGGGNDILSGGAGNDTLDGGAGSDTASYAETTQGVSVNLGLGTAQGTESGSDTLVSIENAIGGSGNDTFDWSSSVGNSDINGGGGTDLVETNNTSTATLTPLADGSAQLAVDGAVITTTDVENLRIRGASTGTSFVVAGDFSGTAMAAGNWVIQGSFSGSPNDSVDASGLTSANSIMFFGEAGNDRFIMAASGANDYFDGAAGVDTVDYSAATAGVMVDLTAGTATGSQIGTDAIVNVENATGGAGNDTLTGSAADNQLSGGGGNDILSGGAGNDTLDGGAGSDTASYAETTQGVSVNLGLGTAQGTESGSDTLVSIENAIGGSGNDTFDWSSSVGNSDINGGGGTDLVETNNTSTATLTPLADGSAQLAVDGAVITTTDVENLRIRGASTGTSFVVAGDFSGTAMAAGNWVIQGSFSGSPNDSVDASGLTSANSIMFFGEAGNDRFIMAASGANDYFDGAAGVDTVDYSAATAGVMVDLTAGTATGSQIGTDAIVNVENATGGAGNDTLTGSAADNQLSGGGGNDILSGGAGNDMLVGGAGADTLDGGAGIDTADYSASAAGVSVNLQNGKGSGGDANNDVLTNIENTIGSRFDDNLVGSNIGNTLNGGAGNDTLNGGGGADTLIGGAGSDVFVFKAVADIGNGTSHDVISDFEAGGSGAGTAIDRIDLTSIDAIAKTQKDDAFTFLGTSNFTHHAGELRFQVTGDHVAMVYGDTDGDGVADFSLEVHYTGTLDAFDFGL